MRTKAKPLTFLPFAMALLTGYGWSLAYPSQDIHGIAWCIPALLAFLWGWGKEHGKRGVVLTASVTHALATLNWLGNMPHAGGALAGWLALSAYCALYPALWAWVFLRWGIMRWKASSTSSNPPLLDFLRSVTWIQGQVMALLGACLWVALEWIVSWLFTGFPWLLLGSTQRGWLPLAQTASLGGVTMISWIMVWLSLSTALGLCRLKLRSHRPWAWIPDTVLPLGCLILLHFHGFWRIQHIMALRPEPMLHVASIQPAFPQDLIWEPNEGKRMMDVMEDLTRAALKTDPDLVLWPESAYPGGESLEGILSMTQAQDAWLCFNGTDVSQEGSKGHPDYYNAAFLIAPDGHLAGTYHKRHLVMFGEYIPWVEQLPWLKRLSPVQSQYRAGKEPVRLRLTNPILDLYPLICFEDVLPSLARAASEGPPALMVNLTNDGWFGTGKAQQQHANLAAFRCIETGLAMVRSGNNGLSCWIDPMGRFQGLPPSGTGSIHARGFQTFQIPIGWQAPTLYVRFGYLFAPFCLIASCLGLIRLWFKSGQRASWSKHPNQGLFFF